MRLFFSLKQLLLILVHYPLGQLVVGSQKKQFAKSSWQLAKSSWQKAEGGRRKAEGSWQIAGGISQPEAKKVIANCILPFANLISTFTGKFYLILIYGNSNKYFA